MKREIEKEKQNTVCCYGVNKYFCSPSDFVFLENQGENSKTYINI